MTNLVTRKGQQLQLNGNLLSGDTYAIKDFIKTYLGGKWNGNEKAWEVDTDKLNAVATRGNHIGLRIDNTPQQQTKSSDNNGYCRKCQSYCYGDCSAN